MQEKDFTQKQRADRGFTEALPQNPLPDFSQESKPVNTKVYIAIGVAIALLMITVTIMAIFMQKPGNKEKHSAEDMINAYVSIVGKDNKKSFDDYIYPKAKNKDDIRKFIKNSQKAFSDKNIYGDMTEMETERVSEKEDAKIRSALGNKVENPQKVSFNVYYSDDTKTSPDVYTTFSFYVGDFNSSTYFAYGSSGETFEIEQEEEPEMEPEKEPEEATATEADAVEEKEPEVNMISVGNPDIGTVEVPSDFILADYDTSVLSKVKSKYTYKSPDESAYVVLIKFANAAKNIHKRAENVTGAFIPDYTIVTGEEVAKIAQAYIGFGESGNSRVETYTLSAKNDGFTRVLAIIAPKDSDIFKIWDTYSVEGGFNTLPGESPIPDVPDGMKIVGNDAIGYILVAEDFVENSEYNYDNSKGWTRGEETIALISEKDSPRASLSLSEYAEVIKETYLGEGAEEWDSGDWFPGALYSRVETEDKKTEVFCFKGKDGINRLLLVYSPGEDAEVSTYYKNYVLPSGVETEMGN